MKNALIKLHIAVFLAGFTAILGKLINLNEVLLVWYRVMFTVIGLALILFVSRKLQRVVIGDAFKLFGVGCIVALHWVSFYGSVKYSTVSVSLTCFSAIGFFTAFLEPLVMRRKVDPVEVGLGLIAIAGIYLIFDFHPQYKVGIAFGMVSALLASIFPVFNKILLKKFEPKLMTLYEMTGGFISLTFLAPLYLYFFPAHYYLPTATDFIWLLVLAGLCTIVSFDLQLQALKKISPFTSNLTYNLEPVYGIILGFIIFHENKYLSQGFYWGLGCIILAVVLQMIRMRRHSMQLKSAT
jgi:drug/metabolite transporter (DMT)-like permease